MVAAGMSALKMVATGMSASKMVATGMSTSKMVAAKTQAWMPEVADTVAVDKPETVKMAQSIFKANLGHNHFFPMVI
jgi:hypothetical protein